MVIRAGQVQDDIAVFTAQIAVVEREIMKRKAQLDEVVFEADKWKEQLSMLQEENDTSRLRKAICLVRNSLFRLRRQERLARLKSETDTIEMEVLRHNYASQKSQKG